MASKDLDENTTALACAESPDDNWKVSGKLIGKPDDDADKEEGEDDKGEIATDVSGMACATTSGFPRVCLVVDDESRGTQIVILKKDKLKAGRFIRLSKAKYKGNDKDKGKPLELDAEAVAYSETDKSFYVIGSHGRPRHGDKKDDEKKSDAKARASRRIFRVEIDILSAEDDEDEALARSEPENSRELSKILENDDKTKKYFDVPLCANGLTIEGLAARSGKLYVGMRGPVLPNGKALVLEGAIETLFDGQPGVRTWREIGLGRDRSGKPRGIRDIARYKDQFLIIAGPVLDPPGDRVEDGDYSIFTWNGTDEPVERLSLKSFGLATKPEALVPLDENAGTLRTLLLFDGPIKGAPRTVEVPMPH